MSPAESAVKDIYFNAQRNLNMMLAACPSDIERAEIKLQYTQARHNYNVSTNKAFHDGDPVLQDLVAKANTTADELKNIEKQLGDIGKVISIITTGVTYGSQIIAKIIAV